MKYTYFYDAYSIGDILGIISELNEDLLNCEIFPEDDILFSIELNESFLEIKFNGETVISSENTEGWEYDYEDDFWAEPLIDFLKGWLLKKRDMFNKIKFKIK